MNPIDRIIKELTAGAKECLGSGGDMEATSWTNQAGILISAQDALELLAALSVEIEA